ncbi:alpha-1,4-N-acetylglucosaminyltransferase-like [Dendropsophus ebraccatus]|uniref:alpha-1,4-N-acetylglucosaminyltransferase-like n=1 Tax=Dendropsophus ebraccatus TaxID=150705 RepID=UPI003831EEBB
MFKQIKIFGVLLLIAAVGFLTRSSLNSSFISDYFISKRLIFINSSNEDLDPLIPSALLRQGKNILFVETAGKMKQPSLTMCSIESAARAYPERSVVYFMQGLDDVITVGDVNKAQQHFPTLLPYKNIYFFPLRMDNLLAYTPLMAWYNKVNPNKERYWIHVKSDACRYALIWKYGGIYMDTDVISIRPIPEVNFLAAEDETYTGSSVFGLSPNHKLTWEFMENFVQNYQGERWGQQGPQLLTRIVRKYCGLPQFKSVDHMMCAKISYFHTERCFPIPCASWGKFYEEWNKSLNFDNTYTFHLWNYANTKKKIMVPRTNTLLEHLYQQYCPSTYEAVLNNKPVYQ